MKISDLTPQNRKSLFGWYMYDWANSGFATSISVAILPVYFVILFQDALGNSTSILSLNFTASSMWSLAIGFSTLLVAITSPVLGVIADSKAIKKSLLFIYTLGGAIFTVLIFFSAYTSAPWAYALGFFIIANIGFAGANVFYNSLLNTLTPPELLDEVSSRGFMFGYVGGGLLLAIHLVVIMLFQDTDHADLITRLAIASVGLWWFGWSIWTFISVPEPKIANMNKDSTSLGITIKESFIGLSNTLKDIKHYKVVGIYLIAYLLFNDGIQTVLTVAGAFAADTLRISMIFVMSTILLIQFVAAPGATFFAKLSNKTGTKRALSVTLIGWIAAVLFAISIAPLPPDTTGSYDYEITKTDNNKYIFNTFPSISKNDENKEWFNKYGSVDEDTTFNKSEVNRLLSDIDSGIGNEKSQYSAKIVSGSFDEQSAVGEFHPSALNNGMIDWWPKALRSVIWAPLNIDAGYQFLLLGVFGGFVMGGSQALARSLFAFIIPDSKSGEFFGFFGFVGRASAFIGPFIYALVAGIFDTRTAIFILLMFIVAGTLTLTKVDVELGRKNAIESDKD